MKKMLGILSGMAFVAALGTSAFAQLEELDVSDVNAALTQGSNTAQDSTFTTDNSTATTTNTTTNTTATTTTSSDSNDQNTLQVSDSFKQDNSITDSGNVADESDNSVGSKNTTTTSASTDTTTNTTTTVTDNSDNSVTNTANDNVAVEATLVQVSANVALPGGLVTAGVDGLAGCTEIKNKIEVENAANGFTGISNINLSSGYFNNSASQITFGVH